MRNVICLMTGVISLVIMSCSNTANFVVTDAAPDAEIKARTRVDEDNNKVLTINARNLQTPELVDSAGSTYVVWIKTTENGLLNVGELESTDDETAVFKAETPYEFSEIIITTEERPNVAEPTGTEIARVDIPEYMVAPMPDTPVSEPFEGDTSGTINQEGILNPYDTLRTE